VNDVANGQRKVKLVIFEGWCVGFRSRPEEEVREVWEEAVRKKESEHSQYNGRLGHVKLEDVMAVNEALKGYDAFTE
jgi:D-glycerate 3-kinase